MGRMKALAIDAQNAAAQYVALVRLSDRHDCTLAAAGETCEHVPADSLAWLLEQGLIVLAEAAQEDTDGRG